MITNINDWKVFNESKFTFKTEKPVGRYRSFYKPTHDIKLNGEIVGSITPEKPFKIRLMVTKSEEDIQKPDNNANCAFKWITLKKESETLEDAKKFINDNFAKIMDTYKIHIR